MSPSARKTAREPAVDPDRAAVGPRPGRPGNRLATASLVTGIAGVTLVTIIPALACGLLGLRRARRAGWHGRGTGRLRCWAGISLAAFWAVAGAYLLPHLVRAADPGCAAYKQAVRTAYSHVIGDFSGPGGKAPAAGTTRAHRTEADLARAAAALDSAAARSHDAATARAVSQLARQLRTMLNEIRGGDTVPASALATLNRDAASSDIACGTVRL